MRVVCTWIAVLLCIVAADARAPFEPPPKPDVMPDFDLPREGSRSLDENWVYAQTLYDASEFSPDFWGAVPVGIAKANMARGFIATLHTVFRTVDGGRTWTNLDPQPPPTPSPVFESFRSPAFISDIAMRPVRRPDLNVDSLYLAVFDTDQGTGNVRVIRGFGTQHVVWPETLLFADRWITSVAAPDSHIAIALAGLDARIYRNDSILTSSTWDTLPEHFGGSWVKEVTTIGNFIYAVGSHQWLSLDRGYSWQQVSAADPLGDIDIDFAPNSARALASGGQEDPRAGWVRYTTDFGQTWSDRTLLTDVPIRAVLLLNDTLGYCAGGLSDDPIGRVWRTTDGGATWELELETEADITELGYVRESGGYINVIAAGYYPDFRGAVWRSHILFPDTSGPALVFSEDTLFFHAPTGESVAQDVTLKNVGSGNITVVDWIEAGPFSASCCTQDVLMQPGDSMVVTITFEADADSEYVNRIRILSDRAEVVALEVVGSSLSSSEPPPLLPQELSLRVYPNPGNAEFRLSYSLPRSSAVELKLFDVTGREVATLADQTDSAGEHVVLWNASSQASGIYFAVLNAGGATQVQKLVLMK